MGGGLGGYGWVSWGPSLLETIRPMGGGLGVGGIKVWVCAMGVLWCCGWHQGW